MSQQQQQQQQDFINNLPTELLFLVFDFLTVKQQRTVKQVCTRWLDILSAQRYLIRYRVPVDPARITSRAYLKGLRRFQAYTIGDIVSEEDLRRFRQFFLRNKVAERVEDLQCSVFRVTERSWMDCLKRKKKICLPKLSKIGFSYLTNDRIDYQFELPSLKAVSLYVRTNEPNCQLLQQCREQIESLHVTLHAAGVFHVIFKRCSFPNLSSLTLHLNFSRILCEYDLDSTQTETFEALKELKIFGHSVADYGISGYHYIIRAAKNLESLSINGKATEGADVLREINNLKKLRNLSLKIENNNQITVEQLALPELQKLYIFGTKVAAIEHICGLSNLKQLKLDCVVITVPLLQKILHTLKHLNQLELRKCLLVDTMLDGDQEYDPKSSGELANDSESQSLRAEAIFGELKAEYPNHVILNRHCFHLGRVPQKEISGEQVRQKEMWSNYNFTVNKRFKR